MVNMGFLFPDGIGYAQKCDACAELRLLQYQKPPQIKIMYLRKSLVCDGIKNVSGQKF